MPPCPLGWGSGRQALFQSNPEARIRQHPSSTRGTPKRCGAPSRWGAAVGAGIQVWLNHSRGRSVQQRKGEVSPTHLTPLSHWLWVSVGLGASGVHNSEAKAGGGKDASPQGTGAPLSGEQSTASTGCPRKTVDPRIRSPATPPARGTLRALWTQRPPSPDKPIRSGQRASGKRELDLKPTPCVATAGSQIQARPQPEPTRPTRNTGQSTGGSGAHALRGRMGNL